MMFTSATDRRSLDSESQVANAARRRNKGTQALENARIKRTKENQENPEWKQARDYTRCLRVALASADPMELDWG